MVPPPTPPLKLAVRKYDNPLPPQRDERRLFQEVRVFGYTVARYRRNREWPLAMRP